MVLQKVSPIHIWVEVGEFCNCSVVSPHHSPCRMRFRAELASNDWIIDYNDVILSSSGGAAASSVAFRSMVSLGSETMKKK